MFARAEDRRPEYPIAVPCRAPGVSRSGYYARAQRPTAAAAARREPRAAHIREVRAEVKGRYGRPRRTVASDDRGAARRVDTAAKAVRARGIRATAAERFARATDSNHRLPVAKNVPGRDSSPARPNAARGMAVAYPPTLEGGRFLALVVDLLSRRVGGWAVAAATTSRLGVDALDPAVRQRGVTAGLVAHSDRGSRYAGDHARAEPRRHGMAGSTSGVGQCRDNAGVEGPFGGLTRERTRHASYATRGDARAGVFEYVEVFYNRVRRPSTLGCAPPAEYERTHNPKLR